MTAADRAWKSREGWRERMAAALAAGGCLTQSAWLQKFPGMHCWFVFDFARAWESCAVCGTVRKANDSNKPCKGAVTVTTRGFNG